MKMNIEKELKILVSKHQFETLLKKYPEAVFHKQINSYYDTPHYQVRKTYGAMRIRELDGQFIFTLKQHTNDGVIEHEMLVCKNSISVFKEGEIQQLLHQLHIEDEIHLIATLTTYRAVIDTGQAELCFDYNEYGDNYDYEIEYEYKTEHDGKNKFNEILLEIGLHYEKNCSSKIARALAE
ncbi:MAG: CYTH domain-containing protein [Erysipelotrichaceae bacterium]|nr:CYTH domain-containing protein [Erysipelotrichaceae bacterium]